MRVLVLDMLENSFRNYRVGYAASEAVVLLAIVLVVGSLTSDRFARWLQNAGAVLATEMFV